MMSCTIIQKLHDKVLISSKITLIMLLLLYSEKVYGYKYTVYLYILIVRFIHGCRGS